MALTTEDLQAIGSIIQVSIQPLQDDLQVMKHDMQIMKDEMQIMKHDIKTLKDEMQTVKDDIQVMKDDIQSLDKRLQNVENRITHVELILENETNHNIQLLAENHINLVDKLNEAIRVQNKSILYEVQVSDLKSRIERLEQEMANIKIKIA